MNNNQDANYRKSKREKQFDEKVKLENRITELENKLWKVQSEKDSAMKDNERFRKWIERLFARIHLLERLQDLSDNHWTYDEVARRIVKL